MPYLKYESDKFGTVMKIKDIQEVDAGKYKCTGENSQGKKEHEFKVDVQGELLTEGQGWREKCTAGVRLNIFSKYACLCSRYNYDLSYLKHK